MCVFSPSISGLQCLLDVCGDYAAETKVPFVVTKHWCFFCPKQYKKSAPSNVFLNGLHLQFFDTSETPWCVAKCLTVG